MEDNRAPIADFGWALARMRNGGHVFRRGWNGKGMFIGIQNAGYDRNTLSYLWIRTADNNIVPWVASQTDLLAMDWEELDT